MMPLSLVIKRSGLNAPESVPFGPLTVMRLPSAIVSSTPLGTSMGFRPIRDISLVPSQRRGDPLRLEDGAEHLTTDTATPRFVPGQDALRGADDGDAESALDSRNGVLARVHPQTGLADPANLADRVLLVRAVPQLDPELVLRLLFDHLELTDVPLVFKHGGNGHQDFGRRHQHL